MAEAKRRLSTKRYGTRYGGMLKEKVAKIERQYLGGKLKCPYCSYNRVKRISAGIWSCDKCEAKFTGKAYNIGKKTSLKETPVTQEFEDMEETPEETTEEELQEEVAEESNEEESQEEPKEEIQELPDEIEEEKKEEA